MTIRCKNWDSDKPEPLFDPKTGFQFGVLMPRIDRQEAREMESHSAEIINLADYRKKTDA